ncbi:endonuclease/exonuclease/phosphatase family protein [soil metagenome]
MMISTFNAENLFSRVVLLNRIGEIGFEDATIQELQDAGMVRSGRVRKKGKLREWYRFTREPIEEEAQYNTARVIDAVNADVVCLQEVEDIETLRLFNGDLLQRVQDSHHSPDSTNEKYYKYPMLLDANDTRYIDVGILSRHNILGIRTHMFDTDDEGPIFRRDCLEIDILTPSQNKITILNCHIKSQIPSIVMRDGEKVNITPEIRKRELFRIGEILKEKMKADREGYYIVIGDLNGNSDSIDIKAMISDLKLINVLEKLPESERWTYIYGTKKYQYDYILLSPGLKSKIGKVEVERRGISRSRTAFDGVRFDTVGKDGTEASDHCSLGVELAI